MSARVFNKQTPKDADYNDFTSIDAYLEFSKNYDRQLLRRQKSLANRARYTNISIIILLLTVSISMAYYTYFLEQNTGKIVENILEKHPEYILTKKDIDKRIHPVNVKKEAIKDHSIILEKKITKIVVYYNNQFLHSIESIESTLERSKPLTRTKQKIIATGEKPHIELDIQH